MKKSLIFSLRFIIATLSYVPANYYSLLKKLYEKEILKAAVLYIQFNPGFLQCLKNQERFSYLPWLLFFQKKQ